MVALDRLSNKEQESLAILRSDPDSYGILRPRNGARLTIKSVSRDTALLLNALETPSELPGYAVEALGEECDTAIAQMVLDQVLQIHTGDGALSGPAAHGLLFDEDDARQAASLLAALSLRALEYADALEITDPLTLAMRLYTYNSVPASAQWRRRIANESAVRKYLGLNSNAILATSSAGWDAVPEGHRSGSWIAWLRRGAAIDASRPTYKLYISPSIMDLRNVFHLASGVLATSAAFHWKVGADVYGLLRPDKFVAHFHDYSALQSTATQLSEKLKGCAVQGVPFTAQIGAGGLLSWGVDPAMNDRSIPWLERESWRGRICMRLGSALAAAKLAASSSVSTVRFALDRLRLDCIDTATWMPSG